MAEEKEIQKPLVNKIAQSGLITLDLMDFEPKVQVKTIDIAQWLFKGLVLREKEFRAELKSTDWSEFQDQIVGLYCSTDAIIPKWAYMLLLTYLKEIATDVRIGDQGNLKEALMLEAIEKSDLSHFRDKKVIIKGCGEREIPAAAYLLISKKLLPIVQSLMFGEACSTVPVYKKKK